MMARVRGAYGFKSRAGAWGYGQGAWGVQSWGFITCRVLGQKSSRSTVEGLERVGFEKL